MQIFNIWKFWRKKHTQKNKKKKKTGSQQNYRGEGTPLSMNLLVISILEDV